MNLIFCLNGSLKLSSPSVNWGKEGPLWWRSNYHDNHTLTSSGNDYIYALDSSADYVSYKAVFMCLIVHLGEGRWTDVWEYDIVCILLSNFGRGGDCNVDDKYFVFTSLNNIVKYNEQICQTQVFFLFFFLELNKVEEQYAGYWMGPDVLKNKHAHLTHMAIQKRWRYMKAFYYLQYVVFASNLSVFLLCHMAFSNVLFMGT